MKMKRFLAGLLLLAMAVTSLGFRPVAAHEDAVVARWTTKADLAPADYEVQMKLATGSVAEQEVPIQGEQSFYQDSDVVTVVVELEEAPLLAQAGDEEIQSFVASAQGQTLSRTLLDSHEAVKAQLRQLSGNVATQSVNGAADLSYDYTTVLNGFSTKLRYGDLDAARALPGVKRVWIAEQYALPIEQENTISMTTSTGMVGSAEANTLGYDGTGTIVAIGDTGIDQDHEAFSVMPTDPKYSREDVAKLLEKSLASGITDVSQVYINEKIPYAYDYAGKDTNAEAVGQSHGVHVAGTVAGNNGSNFHGVAPNAQLMIMKLFSDGSGSTSDDIILAGMDDAVKLGADAINMSLGSPAGFAAYDDEEDGQGLTYASVYSRIADAGVNLMVAAGNETASTLANPYGNHLTLTQYPDNAIVGSPSTYPASMSVASMENTTYYTIYFQVGDAHIAYTNSSDYDSKTPYDILDALDGKTVAYVPVPGVGEASDFEGLDLTGKIALICRGSINFDAKAENAANAGAIAAIIYDNVDGALGSIGLQKYTIPTIMISKHDGEKMIAAEEKLASFSKEYQGFAPSATAGQVSSFSSLGPAPDLGIKPEISAPGGNILSSVIGGGYGISSGTSMATPHMAGLAAVVRQYLQKTYGLTGVELSNRTASLLMSTATPAVDQATGTYFSVRRQGAGLANAMHAIQAEAYLSVEGCDRPKAELGSNENGEYTYTATVHNLSDTDKTYTLDTAVLVETVTEKDGLTFVANQEKRMSVDEATVTYEGVNGDKLTVPAGKAASFTVTIALTQTGKQYIQERFENGTYVEGFTFLQGDSEETDLSLPFLGFFGDWVGLDTLDAGPDGTANMVTTRLADSDASGMGTFLGYNNSTGAYDVGKLAYAPQNGNRMLISQVGLLRNVTSFALRVTAEDGTVMWETGDLGALRKTYFHTSAMQYTSITLMQGWNGRLPVDGEFNAGDWAESGTYYTYSIDTTPVGSNAVQSRAFRVYVDNQAPLIQDVELYEEEGALYLTCLVTDDHFVQRVRIIDSAVDSYYMEAAEEFDAVKEAGAKTRLTFNVTDMALALKQNGRNPGRVGIMVDDMANNAATLFVDIGPQNIILVSTDVAVGAEKQIEYTIKPDRLSDVHLTWTSSDESVVTVDENGVVKGIADGVATITATAPSQLAGRCKVTVGQGVPVYLTYGEAPELNDRFQTADGFCWKVTGGDTVQLTRDGSGSSKGYPELSGDVTVPGTVEYSGKTFRVTSVGAKAFYMNGKIRSVTFQDGLSYVGPTAFFMCSNLEKVQLPDSVEKIDESAFCWSSNAVVNIPKGLKVLGGEAYEATAITEVVLPSTLEEIGKGAFAQCSKLTSAIIPESVISMGTDIFQDCTSLRYVELPQNMTRIPTDMFYGCDSLENLVIPNGVETIGEAAFYGSGLKRLNLPASVKTLERWSFAWLTNLRDIVIPDTVTTIGTYAFYETNDVNTVTIGSGVTSIGHLAFDFYDINRDDYDTVMNVKTEQAATALQRSGYGRDIYLNGVLYEGYYGTQFSVGPVTYMITSDSTVEAISFVKSAAGAELVIPETVECEGDGMTYTVTGIKERFAYRNFTLKRIVLPDTIEYVGTEAFQRVEYLQSINIPQNLNSVGKYSFSQMGSSRYAEPWENDTLVISAALRDWGDSAFSDTKYTNAVVEEGVEKLAFNGLAGIGNLTTLTLPTTLKVIDDRALMGNQSLTQIVLPDALEFIGVNAFSQVPLTSVQIPGEVSFIGSGAFAGMVYNSEIKGYVNVGPESLRLNGRLKDVGWAISRPDAEISAVLNSQRNLIVERSDLEKLPTVTWDGKTDIPFNDGSYVPEDTTLTLDGNVTIDGKLTVDGKVVVPWNVKLTITDEAVIVHPENITYEGCPHEHTTTVTVDATCTEAGSVTMTCDDCGLVLSTEEVPALGHQTERKNEKEATCTEDGYTGDLVCTVCGETVEAGEVIPAHCASAAFTDVNPGSWYHEYVDYVVDQGFMKGMSADRFAPDAKLTRGMLVTTLYRLAGEPEVTEAATFTDVAENRYYTDAIAWAEDLGIAQGMGEGKFAPNGTVTREQGMTFLYRYVVNVLGEEPAKAGSLSIFKDVDQVSGYAKEAMAWGVAMGLLEGYGDGTVGPKNPVTRAQMAKFLTILSKAF